MDTLGGWLSEIRFFYMRQLSVPLSPHGQALWHWLMWRANTVFWQFPLRLSMPEIAGGTKMSEPMVKRARQRMMSSLHTQHRRKMRWANMEKLTSQSYRSSGMIEVRFNALHCCI